MSSSAHSQETNSQIRRQSVSSATSDEDEEFIDDDDSNDRSIAPADNNLNNRNKNKKTLGRVKIKMAYIDNKIRRYTTFSKRKTGIMKKAYELATLTGTEVMLLVASETGHVYTYATAKLQPMITSEAGKALIQTCLAKDEPVIEPVVDPPATILNNNDVIFIDENQRKKRSNTSIDSQSADVLTGHRPIKRAKSKPSEDISSTNKIKQVEPSSLHVFLSPPSVSLPPTTTTVALPLSCFISPDSQQQQNASVSSTFTIDLNTIKNNGMNIIFTPPPSQPSPPSNVPLVLTLGNFPYQPTELG